MRIKKLKKLCLLVALTTTVSSLVSCEKESITTIEEAKTGLVELSNIQLKALRSSGIFQDGNIVEEYKGNILGESIEGIFVHDNFISYKELEARVAREIGHISNKLYINKNKIDVPNSGKRKIRIGVVTSGDQGLDNKQRNAAQTAVHRYNALNLGKLEFEILIGVDNFGSSRPDIVIISSDGFAGVFDGRGRFPSNGNPGDLIGIHTRTQGDNWPQSEVLSLMMHELGHTIGLIHSDYKTRESCIPFGLENAGDFSDSEVEAIIPGANPDGNYTNSIMRACNFYAIGDFTAKDKQSIRKAYE